VPGFDPKTNPQPLPPPPQPGMYPPGPPPSPYPYPSPPLPLRRKVNGWVLAAVAIVVGAIGLVAILAIALGSSSHGYSPAEQQYLAEIHQSHYSWNGDDKELVREGHEVCALLDTNGGNRGKLVEQRMWGYGPNPIPAFLRPYSENQRFALVDAATKHFCDRYTLYIGDTPL
jgi:hypothetical protein